MRRGRRKKLWLIPVCAGIAAAAAAGALVLHTLHSNQSVQTGTAVLSDTGEDHVVWKGTEYVYNTDLSNYLLIGVDSREVEETAVGEANAGQADALYLIARDRVKNQVTVITIPRDTMTEIQLFGPGGTSLGRDVNHISLSYAYGDGSHESCRLTEEAVSNLFYGIPIQSYCAVSMEAMPALTGSLGTVTVTVPNDSLEGASPEFQEGAEVELTPENTELFLRYRDTGVSQSGLDRTERQQAYLAAFGEAAKQRMAEDPGYGAELYAALEPYMVTTMGKDEFVKLAQTAASGETREGWTVPGEGTEGADYDEYRVDDSALYEKIIETFYREAGS